MSHPSKQQKENRQQREEISREWITTGQKAEREGAENWLGKNVVKRKGLQGGTPRDKEG